MSLNGPALELPGLRLPGNLNVSFGYVEGEALLLNLKRHCLEHRQRLHLGPARAQPRLAEPGPLGGGRPRQPVRFGLGRFNTAEEIETVIARVAEAVARLRNMSMAG